MDAAKRLSKLTPVDDDSKLSARHKSNVDFMTKESFESDFCVDVKKQQALVARL
jgi:hypothetical protein